MRQIYEILGFTKTQWCRSYWLSALPGHYGVQIYAKRRGEKKAKVWVGMYSNERHLAVMKSLDYSWKDWEGMGQDNRIKLLQPLVDEFWKNHKSWETIYDYK
jgi:hypothetical protein